MTLESLEERVVLSDVSAFYAGGNLFITSNITATKPGPVAIFGNAFNITENSATNGGTVTVSPGSFNTTVNGFASQSFTTPGPVASIFVTITGQEPSNSETVKLIGPGQGVATTVQDVNFTVTTANLTLSVGGLSSTGVNNSGPLNITETGLNPGLTTSIDYSHFSSVSITQPNACCTGVVELGNTTVDGAVYVKLGDAPSSSITVQNNSSLGSTTLIQGNGAGDSVTVKNSYVQDLTVTQGNGNNDTITVDTVKVSPIGKGVITSQGNGNGDVAKVNAVTLNLSGPANNNPYAIQPSIKIFQGNGGGTPTNPGLAPDVASVTNSSVTGDITISQGNGFNDQATISNSTAGVVADLTSIGMGLVQLNGNANITQGDGYQDQATITGVTVNNVNVKQGNGAKANTQVTSSTVNGSIVVLQGNGNVVPITNPATPTGGVTANVNQVTGSIFSSLKAKNAMTGGISVTQGSGQNSNANVSNATALGNVAITQGGGSGNTATMLNIDPTNLTITQGNGNNQTASITSGVATNNITITQGGGSGDKATMSTVKAGNNIAISQGSGGGDVATIDKGTAGGGISIAQGDGVGDSAAITNSSATTANSPNPNNANNNITITQGNGAKDSALIDKSRADGNFSITQGDGSLDVATISNSTAGFVIPVAPGLVYDWQGNASITQGDGNGDVANFTGLAVNNIYANQGDNNYDPTNCAPGTYDEVHVNSSTVTSDIIINQGDHDGDELGNYYTTIGDVGAVVAGGNTVVWQDGTGDVVLLGGGPASVGGFSFVTNFLDVFSGTGGSFVVATTTNVVQGFQGLFGPWTINSVGAGNTYISGGGNSGVTVNPNFNM